MGFVYTTALRKIRALKKRIKAIRGGTSSSKTISILAILIDAAIKNEALEISVVSESIPHLKKGAMKDFLKIMKWTNRFIPENWNISDRKYTFTNGSYIEFFSADQETSVRGPRRHILYLNECNNITFDTYHQLAIRTSREIYLDWNPSHEFWVDTEVIADLDCDFITLTYKDNEALEGSIIKEIEKAKAKGDAGDSYWANWWKVYGLGQIGSLEGVIFGTFKQVHEFPKDCKWVVYGLDFGYSNDVTALTKIGLSQGEIYLEQMIYQTGLTNIEISNLMKQMGIGRNEIVADSAEQKSIEDLRRMGWNIRGAVKGADSIKNGIDLMKKYNYNIMATSLDLIKEWRGYSWKKDTATNKFLNVPIDTLNHAIDGIRYAMKYKLTTSVGAPRATTTMRSR